MATAPRPGVSQRNKDTEQAQLIITIEILRPIEADGIELPTAYTLGLNNLPMKERMACRKATGLPFAAFWGEDQIDVDSVIVLWWLARRANGEPNLAFAEAANQWPSDLDLEHELKVTQGEPDDEADDPEA